MNHVMSTFKEGVVSAKDGKENGLTKLRIYNLGVRRN